MQILLEWRLSSVKRTLGISDRANTGAARLVTGSLVARRIHLMKYCGKFVGLGRPERWAFGLSSGFALLGGFRSPSGDLHPCGAPAASKTLTRFIEQQFSPYFSSVSTLKTNGCFGSRADLLLDTTSTAAFGCIAYPFAEPKMLGFDPPESD